MIPNIREFSAPQGLGLQPSEVGVEATAVAARRVGAFYNQAGEAQADTGRRIGSTIQDVGDVAVKYEDHREISAGAATGTGLIAQANTQWNEIAKKADPNDPSTAQKFLTEKLEPALEEWKKGFNTENSQKWAEQFADQYRKHMFEKTAADMSSLAGIAVQQNVRTTTNQLSSAVAADPSSLDFALKTVDHTIGGVADSSPNLDAATSAKVKAAATQDAKESIVKAAISGMITKNPNVDLDAIQKKYGAYVDGAELQTFAKAAKTQARVDQLQQKQLETYTRQNNERAAEKRSNDIVTKNVAIDPQTSQPIIKPQFFNDALELAKMPDAPQGLARTLIDWGESQLNKERKPVTDPAVASSIDARMFTDNPTTKMDILKAEAAGKLTRSDAEIRSKIIDQRDKLPSDPQFKLAMDGAKELIEGRSSGEKTLQAGKYAAFMQQFLSEYQQQKAAGTLPPNALSLRDPSSMLSKAMEAYKSPLANAISGNGGITTAPPAPKLNGEVVPAPLRGIAALQYNPEKGLWRDQVTHKIYDSSGQPVKP